MIAKPSGIFTYLAPAFYTDVRAIRYLYQSAARNCVPVTYYGHGEQYIDWFQVQITRLLEEIAKAPTSHILYTDASDAMFLCGPEEIETKWGDLGEPALLLSMEHDTPMGICAGGWLAEKQTAIGCLEYLHDMDLDTRNPQLRWRAAVEWGAIEEAELDVESTIFQITGPKLDVTTVHGEPRIYNPGTRSYPAILHFAGGYSSLRVGKAALIEPLWRKLGYPPTVLESEIDS